MGLQLKLVVLMALILWLKIVVEVKRMLASFINKLRADC